MRGLLPALGFPEELPEYEPDNDENEDPDGDDSSSALNEGEAGESQDGDPESVEGMEMRDSAEDGGESMEDMEQVDPGSMEFDDDDSETPGESTYPPNFGSNSQAGPAYHAFCTEFDEVVDAVDLCDTEELTRLRQNLDQQLINLQSVIARLANRLQRRLMAKQTRAWEFDLEEGILDTARLARIVANPMYTLSYKRERETNFRNTVVTLLIDNSGSMRGRPIVVAANKRRHPGSHIGAMWGKGRDPRVHHSRLEGRPIRASAGCPKASHQMLAG